MSNEKALIGAFLLGMVHSIVLVFITERTIKKVVEAIAVDLAN